MTDHNGKEIKTYKGKNIRISDKGWEVIRKYCFAKNIAMGAFIEEKALAFIKDDRRKRKPSDQSLGA